MAAPQACPGALDAAAAIGARLAPRLPLGSALVVANRILLVPALALTVIALSRWSGSWIAAGVAGLALACQPLLNPVASPFDPIVMLAAAAILASEKYTGGSRVRFAAAGAIVLLLIVRWGTPALPPEMTTAGVTCLVPFASAAHWRAWLDGSRSVISAAGPYAVALAAVGVYAIVSRKRSPWLLLALALLPAIDAQEGQTLVRGFGTLIVAFWVLVASGLSELVQARRRTIAGTVAAAAFLVMLPIFQVSAMRSRPAAIASSGVERLNTGDVKRLLALLPDRSVLIEEDAAFSALLRAASGTWRRMGKDLRIVRATPEAVARVAAEQGLMVFALPRSQAALQWQGVTFRDAGLPGIDGLAHVVAAADCPRVRARWVHVPAITASQVRAMSVVTNETGGDHAVQAYVASSAEPHVTVIQPAGQEPLGFHHDIYHASKPDERAKLDERMAEDRLAPELLGAARAYVTRMEFWRSSALPRIIGVDLGFVPDEVVVRTSSSDSADVVCPVVPYLMRPFTMRK